MYMRQMLPVLIVAGLLQYKTTLKVHPIINETSVIMA